MNNFLNYDYNIVAYDIIRIIYSCFWHDFEFFKSEDSIQHLYIKFHNNNTFLKKIKIKSFTEIQSVTVAQDSGNMYV